MTKLILLTTLITLVYSFDDLKRVIERFAYSLRKQKYSPQASLHNDQFVASAILLATVPANLVYLLLGQSNLITKLVVILAELLVIALAIEISEYLIGKTAFALTSILTLVILPPLRLLATGSERQLLASYIRHLSVPLAFGLVLKLISDRFGPPLLQAYTDSLSIVVMGALFILLAINTLERYFRMRRMHILSYYRIILGIAIIFTLGMQFVR